MADDEQSQHRRGQPTKGANSGKRNNRQRHSSGVTCDDEHLVPGVSTRTSIGNEIGQPDEREEEEEESVQIDLNQETDKLHEYYDHNRNLTDEHQLGDSAPQTRVDTTISSENSETIERSKQQQHQNDCSREKVRYSENVSPVGSSLSTQSNASGDSAQAHYHCEPYGGLNSSSSSDHSTERMSQTSLVAATTTTTTTTTTSTYDTMTNEGSQQERVVKFQVGEVINLQHLDFDEKKNQGQQHTAITIGMEEQHQRTSGPSDEQEDEFGQANLFISCQESTKQANAGRSASLVRQLGRRVSLLPQTLRRQMTGHQLRDAHQSMDDPRRYSLPVQGHGAPEVDEMSPLSNSAMLHSGQPLLADPVPTTVAGVGGTITTVTRSKRKTAPLPRLVAKNGQVNLFLDNIDRRQYMRDLFTTMIDIKWRYNLMAAAFGFVFSWLFFACIWYLVLYFHNDLEHENDPNWSPCIVNVYSFPAALLFSIETQSTLGFGSRIISVECPGAILIFCSQLIFGVVVECLIVGMVFAKLSRPTKRSQTIMYSKYATVCLREGKMCLTFRVGDVRSKSHIIGATLRASLVSSKVTQEGEIIPFYHHKLKVIIDDCKNSLLLIWPVTIVHVIDESSPFYKLNSDELINFKFEIITVLEGTVESTGQSIQVRSSYLPSEVKWGYRFEPIVSTHGYGKYAQTIIDYNKFNRIIEVPTPKCSPLDYYADQATLHCVQIPDGVTSDDTS